MKRIASFIAVPIIALGAVLAPNAPASQDAMSERTSLTLNVYALDTCPVSGEKLGSMGEPVVKTYEVDGVKREVRFCCAGCVEPFEKDSEKFSGEIDVKLIEQQIKHYPLTECLVSGRSLEESETAHNAIHEGRLVRFCCPACPPRLKANPARYLKRLDDAIIEQQREKYPVETCVIAGAKLGSMGEPYEVIVGGTLVRFCCAGCLGGFKDDPAKHLATIRDAWRKQHESANADH